MGLEGSGAGGPGDGKIERQSGRNAGGRGVFGREGVAAAGSVLGDFTAVEVEVGADYRCCLGTKVVYSLAT